VTNKFASTAVLKIPGCEIPSKVDGVPFFILRDIHMAKRKNRPHPYAIKRRCVESDDSGFAFMMILIATIILWLYLAISICKFV